MKKLSDLSLPIASHQANIQRLGVAYGAVIYDHVESTEKRLIDAVEDLVIAVSAASSPSKIAMAIKKAEFIIKEIRMKGYAKSEEIIFFDLVELAVNESKWGKSVTKALSGAAALSVPSERAILSLVKNGFFDGKSVNGWFEHIADNDLSRIVGYSTQGALSGMTIDQIRRGIIGTKAANYSDGIIAASRSDAEAMARTIVSGVANAAKMELYRENQDVVLQVQILSTLDGKTCPVCASIDGKRYGVDDPKPYLPIHPNCRCVYIPVTAMSDEESTTRPMANADFDAEAKRLYQNRYPDKNYDDLSASTREKYYYQAMRSFESRTGSPAYSQAPGSMTFKQYFQSMTEQQKQDWLGPQRYEIYKRGNLPLSDFIRPYPDREFTVKRLKELDIRAMKQAG